MNSQLPSGKEAVHRGENRPGLPGAGGRTFFGGLWGEETAAAAIGILGDILRVDTASSFRMFAEAPNTGCLSAAPAPPARGTAPDGSSVRATLPGNEGPRFRLGARAYASQA